jgi:hypothetical protein
MYGPKPGERVCKVNFSRLSDQEKRNTNLLLAKQEHEIVFDEEGDHFVANVKFIKSPARYNLSRITDTQRLTSKSKSPQKTIAVDHFYLSQRQQTKILPQTDKKHTIDHKEKTYQLQEQPSVPSFKSSRRQQIEEQEGRQRQEPVADQHQTSACR